MKYNVTFSEVNTYRPMTRTIVVETKNEFVAREIVLQQYGRKKIRIDKVEEIKDAEGVDTSKVE